VHRLVFDAFPRSERLAKQRDLAAPREQIAAEEIDRIARQSTQLTVDVDPAAFRARRRLLDIDTELVAQSERAARWSAEKRAGRVLVPITPPGFAASRT
jgi:hypothetical protein